MLLRAISQIFAIIVLAYGGASFGLERPVRVAIIDTGVDLHHPHLKNRIYTTKGIANEANYGEDHAFYDQSPKRPYDQNGHGTHIAGIIAKHAPKAQLFVFKYYHHLATGEENLHSTISALKAAIDANVDIINYSSGGPEKSIVEEKLFKLARKKGIIVITAAGNNAMNVDESPSGFYPASYHLENIITVGAHDDHLNKVPSSNWGKETVDIFAPGHKIKSAFPKFRLAELTGTSQATAFVTSAVANILSKTERKLKASEVRSHLKKLVEPNRMFSSKCTFGGVLDLEKMNSIKPIKGQLTFRVSAN